MIHWKARKLLPDLVDGALAETAEARLRGHVQGCAPCRRILAELEAADELLRSFPASLVPIFDPAGSETRLAALAQWSKEPRPIWRERFGASALGAFAVAAGLALLLVAGRWTPLLEEPSQAVALAAVMPDAGQYAPLGWR